MWQDNRNGRMSNVMPEHRSMQTVQWKPLDESDYVDRAEKAILKLKELKNPRNGKALPIVTTSKIRNLLAMVADIYNDVLNVKDDKLNNEIVGRINYMKLRFYYEAGREDSVKRLLETAGVFDAINGIGSSRKNYILFSRYMEALVAFRKYHCENDG